jgi:alpha-N-arabinofuranosidase
VNGNRLIVTAVNLSLTDPLPANVSLHGLAAKEAKGRVLAESDIHAHNTFAQPEAVKPRDLAVQIGAPGLRLTLPPMSVVKVEAMLG